MPELIPSPHPESKGMTADGAKYLQAVAIAQQTGKSVEEVLAFMGITAPVSGTPSSQTATPQTGELPPALQDAKIFLPEEEVEVPMDAKVKAPVLKKEASPDETGFVVTEVVDPSQATEAELDQAFPEEENNWDSKIREGSKVRVTHTAPGSRIKWSGKIGKVTRVIGNEKAKVYEVEFKGQKIPKVRLNKKTGKLERGYVNKKLTNTFDEQDIDLVD